jgi:5'-3' exonuclease
MDPALLAQFPIAEEAIEALGVVLWPETEFEADDAIGAAAARFAADPVVERVLICTPDKDMAQCVVGDRVVLRDRRRQITYDRDGVLAKWGVEPASIPDWLALVGDSADGFPGLPGWGAKSAAAVLRVYGSIDDIPPKASEWRVPGLSGAVRLAAVLADQRDAADLYRTLARLRLDTPIPQQHAAELEWRGTPRATWEAFCDRLGLDRLRSRPHRWADQAA